jgi:hypothetical protein
MLSPSERFWTPARKTKEHAVSGMTDKNGFRPGYEDLTLLGGRGGAGEDDCRRE